MRLIWDFVLCIALQRLLCPFYFFFLEVYFLESIIEVTLCHITNYLQPANYTLQTCYPNSFRNWFIVVVCDVWYNAWETCLLTQSCDWHICCVFTWPIYQLNILCRVLVTKATFTSYTWQLFSLCNLICNLSHQLRGFKLQKRSIIKMAGDKALVMISLVIILSIFSRSKRSFIQRMRLMSLQMRRMRRNANPTTKQHSVIRVRRLSESSFSSVCTSFLTLITKLQSPSAWASVPDSGF